MKKYLLFLLIVLSFAGLIGCSDKVEFYPALQNTEEFHKLEAAEKIGGGLVYFDENKLVFQKDNATVELATDVTSAWIEGKTVYYVSGNVLYNCNVETQSTEKMVEKPYNILGKYNGNIVSYHGENVYSINGSEKTKIFEDGYYLNRAVLYGNKIYGIPASNVYEYNLDTLEVTKVTNKKHDLCGFVTSGDELYIYTAKHKNEKNSKNDFTYYKVTDNGLDEIFSLSNIYDVADLKIVKDAVFVATQNNFDEVTDGNRLLFATKEKVKEIDDDHSYEILGIFENKLLYYKNKYTYGTEQDNLESFYLYDGKSSEKAFDLDVGFYEAIIGYEYENGIIIAVVCESSTELYQYDGSNVSKIDTSFIYRISSLDVIDGRAYIRYSDGEESSGILGKVIDLK